MVDLDLCVGEVIGGFALLMGWRMEAYYRLGKGNMRFASVPLSMEVV